MQNAFSQRPASLRKRAKGIWSWLVLHPERLMVIVLGVGAAAGLALILTDRLFLYGGDIGGNSWDYSNRLYLLSTVSQSLAAILALVVSLTLVATQLAAQTYSPRVVNLRLRDPWFWGGVALYLVAILWAMGFHGWLDALGPKSASVALLLAGTALLYLVPFTLATLHSLQPHWIAESFVLSNEDEALDDMLRKAVNDGLISALGEGLAALTLQVLDQLLSNAGSEKEQRDLATRAGNRLRSIGRHACQRGNADALEAVQDALGAITEYSTTERWREAANALNGVAMELEDYALYSFGEFDEKDIPDIARLSLKQADRFHNIARVQAQSHAPQADRETNLRRTVKGYERALAFYTRDRHPSEFGQAQNKLGAVYRLLSDVRDKETNLTLAIAAHTEALKVYTLSALPVQYAAIQTSLGNAYSSFSDVRDKETNLTLAISAHTKALKVYTLAAFPTDYAMTQNNLGIAYCRLAEVKDKEANLFKAIAAYTEALKVYTLATFPLDYATAQNNLGNAHRNVADVKDKEANLRKAIAAYAEALKVHTVAAFPTDFAVIQNNLGNAYKGLSEIGNKEANLSLAITAYTVALKVRTLAAFPVQYAATQNNLGNAYGGLSEIHDREANIDKAVAAYKEAVKVNTAAAFPTDYAGTTFNLAILHLHKGSLAEAERAFGEAERVFREQGMVDWAHRAQEALKDVQEQMKRRG